MEYITQIDSIKGHQIIFKQPVKNQNNKYINYYKLLYSDPNVHLKYLLIPININFKEQLLEKIKVLEYLILSNLNQHIEKQIKISLYHDIFNKDIPHSSQNLYLKISGIWENNTQIGLVYRLYYTMSTVKFSNIIC